MSTRTAVIALFTVLCVTTSSRAEVSCPLDALSVVSIPGPIPLSFDEFKFATGPNNSIAPDASMAAFRITNHDPRPINAIFMVVDFYKSGRYLLSMTFYLATSAKESFKPVVPRSPSYFSPSPLHSSLLTGQSYRDWDSSALRPASCPDEARLAVLQVVFADRTVFDHRMPGWRVDPVLCLSSRGL